MRDVVASALGDRWPGAQVGSNRTRSRCFVNPNSRRPNPATLSPVRRRRPTGPTIAILYPCIRPTHTATPRVTLAPNLRRQPQPPTFHVMMRAFLLIAALSVGDASMHSRLLQDTSKTQALAQETQALAQETQALAQPQEMPMAGARPPLVVCFVPLASPLARNST